MPLCWSGWTNSPSLYGIRTEAAFSGLRRPERAGHQSGAPGSAVGVGHGFGHVPESASERGLGLCAVREAGVSGGPSSETLGPGLCRYGFSPVVVQLGRN